MVSSIFLSADFGSTIAILAFALLIYTAFSWIIFQIVKGHRELTQEKIDRNNKRLVRQKNSSTLILYLRDFAVDRPKTAYVKFGIFERTFTEINFETELSLAAGKVGHFIAVGISNQDITAGAERYTVEDEIWKDRISELMEESSMILIRPSLSVGLIWELEQLVQNKYLKKTVICYHKKQDGSYNYKLFRDMTKHFVNLPSSFFAARFMCLDEERRVFKHSSLEDTQIFNRLLEKHKKSIKTKRSVLQEK